jgi:tetratricopeptide (TPR) repeat protein
MGICDAFLVDWVAQGAPYAVHRTIEMTAKVEMKSERRMKKTAGFSAILALFAVVCPAFRAQAPAPAQQNPQGDKQQKPPADSNPFPEDTGNVPVLPGANQPVPREAPSPASNEPFYGPVPALPAGDQDPVRSPDEPLPDMSSSSGSSSSSSSADLARILEPPPDEENRKAKKGKGVEAPAENKETAQQNESVGQFYLDQKNWRAALSRFQSALILDPENPDVYWGLAESQRHLGDVTSAKANYMKVVEYDPDSRHGKEAKKLLKDPEMAAAPAARP